MSTSSRTLPRIGITVGDPAGVGPEVVLKAFLGCGKGSGEPLLRQARVVLIGPVWLFRDAARRFGFRVRFEPWHSRSSNALRTPVPPAPEASETEDVPAFPVLEPEGCEALFEIPYGREDALCGATALRAIEEAVRVATAGDIDAIVTAPISKAAIHAAGSRFPGHTEMLQSLCGSPRVGMMLVGGGLRVSLVTIHEAYAAVPRLLTVDRIAAMIELTHDFLYMWGFDSPRLALAALNPHAGEGGLFGDEETRLLIPAMEAASAKTIQVEGPFPADTVFHLAREGRFDAVVALYHDQALIPIKTLDFHGGVNVTMGLPLIRTSPDHGTAYPIAGQGVARATSTRNAVRVAIELVDRRRKTG